MLQGKINMTLNCIMDSALYRKNDIQTVSLRISEKKAMLQGKMNMTLNCIMDSALCRKKWHPNCIIRTFKKKKELTLQDPVVLVAIVYYMFLLAVKEIGEKWYDRLCFSIGLWLWLGLGLQGRYEGLSPRGSGECRRRWGCSEEQGSSSESIAQRHWMMLMQRKA